MCVDVVRVYTENLDQQHYSQHEQHTPVAIMVDMSSNMPVNTGETCKISGQDKSKHNQGQYLNKLIPTIPTHMLTTFTYLQSQEVVCPELAHFPPPRLPPLHWSLRRYLGECRSETE